MESRESIRPIKPAVIPGSGEDTVIQVLENSTDAFYVLDAGWNFVFLNEAAKAMIQPHLDECADSLVGKKIWEFFPATKGSIVEQKFHQAVDGGVSLHFESFYEPWSKWYSVRVFPVKEGGLSVYFRDITADKQSAAAVIESEKKYKMLFTSMDEGFCIVDIIRDESGQPIDYRFLETNPAFIKHTGLDGCAGKTIRELRPGHSDYWQVFLGSVASSGQSQRFTHHSESLGRWLSGSAFRVNETENDDRVAVLLNDITQQKLAEEETRRLQSESRERVVELETLLSVLPIGIGIASDRECREIRSNPALAELLGVKQTDNASKTAPEGERPITFRVTDDTGRELSGEELPMQIAAQTGQSIRGLELNIERSDGKTLRLLEYVAPLFDDNGQARGSVGAFVDITERRRSEERRHFIRFLDDTIRSLNDANEIVTSASGLLGEFLKVDRCLYVSLKADEDMVSVIGEYACDGLSDFTPLSISQLGQEALNLLWGNSPFIVQDIEKHEPPVEDLSAYQARQIRGMISVPLHKGERLVGAMMVCQKEPRTWTESEASIISQVAKRCWEAIERTTIARELQASNERFRLLADNMVQMAWMAEADGTVFWFNSRWHEFTGKTAEESQGWGWQDVHPKHLDRVSEKWKQHIKSQELWEDTFPMLDKKGHFRWFLGRALPVRSAEGEVVRWFGTHTDITDQMRTTDALAKAKEEAEKANQAKDEFLAVLSHELRTPLTPVLLSVASLEEDEHLSEDLRADLAIIRRNIELEARLIDDLLDVTRIARGKMSLRHEDCDIHAVINLAVGILIDELQQKRVRLVSDLGATNTALNGDPARLQQVLWNILKNAMKFTPSGGQISITTRNASAETIAIEVTDNGIGMSPESLDLIFRPFEQGGLANDHRFGGLGLGLSISKAIVDLHGGTIKAESSGLGLGSTFYITLPVARQRIPLFDKPVIHGESGPAATAQSTQSSRILLVEDHEPTLKVLSRLLKREGYEVIAADSVVNALAVATENVFDVVVSDIGLPDGTGYDLMKSLKVQHDVPGIALTGYGSEDDHLRSKEAGFVVHLTKPVSFVQLKNALSVCLAR